MKDSARKTAERVSPRALLVERVKKIKSLLPKNYKSIVIEMDPSYDSYKGVTLIQNVVNLRTADEKLTQILEAIAAEYIKWPSLKPEK